VNFNAFSRQKPAKVSKFDPNIINSISLGRSVEQWSTNIRESFCGSLYGAVSNRSVSPRFKTLQQNSPE